MVTPVTLTDRASGKTVLARLLVAAGSGLAGYGTYMHYTIGDRTLGNRLENGACNPWHPLWVVAPLAIGASFLLLARLLRTERI